MKLEYTMLEELRLAGNDIEGAVGRMMENQALLNKFLLGFPDNARILNVKKALGNSEFKSLEEAVHKIKGTAGNLGLTALYKIASTFTDDVRRKNRPAFADDFKLLEDEYLKVTNIINKYIVPVPPQS
ncbi:MAG: Hpt domain-containing protein [Ruminococcus sp.]|jgi:HPt (histidine-containing phosphotransfer) domain-containing protein|nr:Hpt domain-containing protein [Ruminococcus sp.]